MMQKDVIEFGDFRLEVSERLLFRDGRELHLTPKIFDLLYFFVSNPGRLLTKTELMDTVWAGVEVEESAITRAISDLRRTLGRSSDETFIETVPKFGYRFVMPVRSATPHPAESVDLPPVDEPADLAQLRQTRRRWPILAGAFALVALIVAGVSLGRGRWGDNLAETRTLAVLPFQVIGKVSDPDALGVGLADSLVTRLCTLPGMVLRPTGTVRQVAAASGDPLEAGRRLAVDAVVEATVQIIDGRARGNVRLIRVRDGQAIWSGIVESPANQLFTLEDDLVQQIAPELSRTLVRRTEGSRDRIQQSLLDEHYYRGRAYWMRRDSAGIQMALAEFQRALALDPTYAEAHSGVADCYLMLGLYNFSPAPEMLAKARLAAQEAIRLQPELASAHATLGLIAQNLDRDWNATESHYRRAIQLAPGLAGAHHWYAEFLSIQGRFEESAQEFAKARAIDPISSIIQVDEAQLWYFARQYDRSRKKLLEVQQLDPQFSLAREHLAMLYMAEGRLDDAWKTMTELPECGAESMCWKTWSAWLGRPNPVEAARSWQALEQAAGGQYIAPRIRTIALLRRGHINQALDILEQMAAAHEVGVVTAKVEPAYDPLRGSPRFQQLLRLLGLA